jgi:hypothetical protein
VVCLGRVIDGSCRQSCDELVDPADALWAAERISWAVRERIGIRQEKGGEFKECLPCVIELLQIGIVFVSLPLLLGEDATPRTRLVMGQAFEGAQAHKHRYVRIDEFRARSIRVEPLGDIGCKDG